MRAGEPMVLVSDLSERAKIHYVKITLRGVRSSRSGLGAMVKVGCCCK